MVDGLNRYTLKVENGQVEDFGSLDLTVGGSALVVRTNRIENGTERGVLLVIKYMSRNEAQLVTFMYQAFLDNGLINQHPNLLFFEEKQLPHALKNKVPSYVRTKKDSLKNRDKEVFMVCEFEVKENVRTADQIIHNELVSRETRMKVWAIIVQLLGNYNDARNKIDEDDCSQRLPYNYLDIKPNNILIELGGEDLIKAFFIDFEPWYQSKSTVNGNQYYFQVLPVLTGSENRGTEKEIKYATCIMFVEALLGKKFADLLKKYNIENYRVFIEGGIELIKEYFLKDIVPALNNNPDHKYCEKVKEAFDLYKDPEIKIGDFAKTLYVLWLGI